MKQQLLCSLLLLAGYVNSHAQNFQRLHKKAIVIDTHNDFISTGIEKNKSFDMELKGITHSDLNRMKTGGIDIQIFSIFC
ncbi:MAG: membrane dipeptidase, partial [Chitinophagaceae bacterium]